MKNFFYLKSIFATFLISSLCFANSASAQTTVTKMQSLYIYNFIKNIKWKNIDDKYIVGMFANDATIEQFTAILGTRSFNGKMIEVKKILLPAQASNCHVVYVSSKLSSNIKKMHNSNVLKNTLVVSEKGGLENGASIAFVLENSRLKFKINEAACKTSNLQISASLLSLGV